MVKKSIYEVISPVIARISDRTLQVQSQLLGKYCRLYFPISNPSPFQQYSGNLMYNEKPDLKDYYIVTNMYEVSRFSDATLSPFEFDEPVLLAESTTNFPKDTKVEVSFGKEHWVIYRIDHVDSMRIECDFSLRKMYILEPMDAETPNPRTNNDSGKSSK